MMVKRSGRLVESKLLLEDGKYRINFRETEEILKDGVDMIIFCSPTIPWGGFGRGKKPRPCWPWQINTVLSS